MTPPEIKLPDGWRWLSRPMWHSYASNIMYMHADQLDLPVAHTADGPWLGLPLHVPGAMEAVVRRAKVLETLMFRMRGPT